MGQKRFESTENVGPRLAGAVERLVSGKSKRRLTFPGFGAILGAGTELELGGFRIDDGAGWYSPLSNWSAGKLVTPWRYVQVRGSHVR